MSGTTAIIPYDGDERLALERPSPKAIIQQATEEADVLAEVINSRQLYSVIQGKKFTKVEGWTTLATLRGCLPREVSVTEMPEGRYVAEVELVRMSDGMVLTRASAECGGPEDHVWQSRPPNARRSMAITRATGKACRVAFSWVMALAGFEVTPAEEMTDNDTPAPKPKPTGKIIETALPDMPAGVLKYVGKINKHILKDKRHAIAMASIDGTEDYGWLSTYDAAIGEQAKKLFDGGDIAEAWYIVNGAFKNLTDISAAIFEK